MGGHITSGCCHPSVCPMTPLDSQMHAFEPSAQFHVWSTAYNSPLSLQKPVGKTIKNQRTWWCRWIYIFIKWSGILANFASSRLVETCFPRPYLRVSTPQILNDGLFGVSDVTTRTQVYASIICSDWRVWCALSCDVEIYAPHFCADLLLRLSTPLTFLCDQSQFHLKFPII